MGRSGDLPRRSGLSDGDDSGSPILHMDMDAFYASVEVRRRPELRGRAVIVGGGQRGVVSAASYEARRYGVRSAMPMSTALRRCPNAVVITPDHATYAEASRAIMAILRDVTPLVEPLSLDEAFLDVSGVRRLLGRPAVIAAQIRARVLAEQRLTCSVGVAPTKFVAKVASARCKPDGMLVVPADGVLDFLHPLPVTALWGVGPNTAQRLERLGLRTVGDVAQTPRDLLVRGVGVASADHLGALAAGHDPRAVEPLHVEKSISVDRTFDVDLTDLLAAERELFRLADELGRRIRSRELVARTLSIKVRFADFTTISRSRTAGGAISATDDIHRGARELFRALDLDRPRIRLLGVRLENLEAAGTVVEQLSFEPRPPSAALDRITDVARGRFGPAALGRASLLGPKVPRTPANRPESARSDPPGPRKPAKSARS